MAYLNRALHRRPRKEQDAVAMLRGERDVLRASDHGHAFDELRQLAQERGLIVQASRTAYLGDDELLLLSWLAAAQRPTSERLLPGDVQITSSVLRCAAILTEAGIRLHPITLYQHHLGRVTRRLDENRPTCTGSSESGRNRDRDRSFGSAGPSRDEDVKC